MQKGYVVDMGYAAWYQGSDITECNDSAWVYLCIPCDSLYSGGWKLKQEAGDSFDVLSSR